VRFKVTTLTGGAITWYKWLVAKHALKMEKLGLRSRHFRAARSRLLAELGLPPRTRNDKMLEAVEAKIKECEASIKPGEVES
jgi:hypothetical protein